MREVCIVFSLCHAVRSPTFSLVELECPETQLCVLRARKAQRPDPVSLEVPSDVVEGKEFAVPLPIGRLISPSRLPCRLLTAPQA